MGGWRRALLGAVLVLAAIGLAPAVWAQGTTDGADTSGAAGVAAAVDPADDPADEVAEDERCENPTLNGPDCEGALAECDALGDGQDGCAALLECVILTAAQDPAYFPFECWPDALGQPEAFLCRLISCPGSPPSYCEIRDIRLLGWCKDGELIDPSTLPSTTTTTSTTTTSTTTTTPATTSTTTTAPSTTTTTAPTTTTTTNAPTTTAPAPTTTVLTTSTTTSTSVPAPTTVVPSTTAPPPTVLVEDPPCDTNYAGACVPVADGDAVDCADVPGANFAVIGDDLYRLDEDDDGVACEREVVEVAPTATPAAVTPVASSPQVAGTSTARSLAITGTTASGLLLLAVTLLAAGVTLLSSGIRTARRRTARPGGYTFSSVDDLGVPTRYHVRSNRPSADVAVPRWRRGRPQR